MLVLVEVKFGLQELTKEFMKELIINGLEDQVLL
jgi:hypothetical protein